MILKASRKLDEYFMWFFNRTSKLLVNLESYERMHAESMFIENSIFKLIYCGFEFDYPVLRIVLLLSYSSGFLPIYPFLWPTFTSPRSSLLPVWCSPFFPPQNRMFLLRTGNLKKISIFVSFINLLTCEWKVSTNHIEIARDMIKKYFYKFMVIVDKIKYVSLWIERNLVASPFHYRKKDKLFVALMKLWNSMSICVTALLLIINRN